MSRTVAIRPPRMAKLRVHNFSISLDGYAAGPDQSLDHPLGVGGNDLHDWAFATRTFRTMFGQEQQGSTGVDDEFAAAGDAGIGVGTDAATHVRLTRTG